MACPVNPLICSLKRASATAIVFVTRKTGACHVKDLLKENIVKPVSGVTMEILQMVESVNVSFIGPRYVNNRLFTYLVLAVVMTYVD